MGEARSAGSHATTGAGTRLQFGYLGVMHPVEGVDRWLAAVADLPDNMVEGWWVRVEGSTERRFVCVFLGTTSDFSSSTPTALRPFRRIVEDTILLDPMRPVILEKARAFMPAKIEQRHLDVYE